MEFSADYIYKQWFFVFVVLQFTAMGLTLPSIEPCPTDSELVDGICTCKEERCVKPPCLSTLEISVEGSGIPGNCCPTYTCTGCSNDTLIEGTCPCAQDAIINQSTNKCECVDKEKTLKDGVCVCDPDQCELPQLCDKRSVPVIDNSGCCKKTTCIPCPDDSFPSNHNSEDIEDKCLCYRCKNQECGVNETILIIEKGTNFPGQCCDLYRCEKIITKYCVTSTRNYTDGEFWETDDDHRCVCQGGISLCSSKLDEKSQNCHIDGKIHKNHDSWMEDYCTNCTCINGEKKCVSHFCENKEGYIKINKTLKKECHPLVNCNKNCPNGFKIKNGCEICKCNYNVKCSSNNTLGLSQEVLAKYNVTGQDVIEILEARRITTSTTSTTTTTTTTSTPTPSTSTPSTESSNIPNKQDITTREPTCVHNLSCTENNWLMLLGSIILGITIGAILTCIFPPKRWCCWRRSQGSMEISQIDSKYSKVHHKNVHNENNNYTCSYKSAEEKPLNKF